MERPPSTLAKSSTSFVWGKGGNITSVGWQVTLCDPIWHVSSRSGVATLRTAIHLLLTYLFTVLLGAKVLAQSEIGVVKRPTTSVGLMICDTWCIDRKHCDDAGSAGHYGNINGSRQLAARRPLCCTANCRQPGV